MQTITPLILTADSGSTKTDWLLQQGKHSMARRHTQGINPFMLPQKEIEDIVRRELLTDDTFRHIDEICFYGAGCRGAQCAVVEKALRAVWPCAASIIVDSDLVGAAKALCRDNDGVACILGTGSNSCLYVDGEIRQNVSPLGYILGDEGSGAVLGRRLLGDVLKHQLPHNVCEAFEATYHLASDEIIHRVYKEPFANRFLASFAPFLAAQRHEPAIHALLVEEFSRFFRRNVAQYGRRDLPVSFVGSIAYHFSEELRQAAAENGFRIGKIMHAPLDE